MILRGLMISAINGESDTHCAKVGKMFRHHGSEFSGLMVVMAIIIMVVNLQRAERYRYHIKL